MNFSLLEGWLDVAQDGHAGDEGTQGHAGELVEVVTCLTWLNELENIFHTPHQGNPSLSGEPHQMSDEPDQEADLS